MIANVSEAPFRSMIVRKPEVVIRDDGDVMYLRHPEPLAVQDADVLAMLERCCEQFAHRTFIAERADSGWRTITYTDFINRVQRAAAALEMHGTKRGTRVGLLARNGIDHAIVSFAALALGAVVVPLPTAYLLHPQGASMIGGLAAFANVAKLVHEDQFNAREIAIGDRLRIDELMTSARNSIGVIPLSARREHIKPDDVAKIFFTSGSTGTPKAVRLTHSMLASAASMLDQIAPRLPSGLAGRTVDWLPWTHTFGGNVNVHAALMRGKTLHVDTGAPLPGRFEATLQNLSEVCPTEFSSVPAAYPLLLRALEERQDLAHRFFSNVHTCSYGGAALSPSLVERLQALAVRTCGQRIPFGGGYGMTESCGLLMLVYWLTERTDLLGLPVPGVELKLVRLDGDRWECRVRGPNIFVGYGENNGDDAFDAEGYFITGDAVGFASPGNPLEGVVFAGRLKEDFKLSNGTWVRAGSLREALLDKLRPHASDLIIVGENRDELAALVWTTHPPQSARQRLLQLCREFNVGRPAATQRIARLSICERLPDATAGEVTVKGTINARRLQDNQPDLVEKLYSSDDHRV